MIESYNYARIVITPAQTQYSGHYGVSRKAADATGAGEEEKEKKRKKEIEIRPLGIHA